MAGRPSGAWRRSMENSGTDMPSGDGGREPTVQEHPEDAVLSAADFQVSCTWCRGAWSPPNLLQTRKVLMQGKQVQTDCH